MNHFKTNTIRILICTLTLWCSHGFAQIATEISEDNGASDTTAKAKVKRSDPKVVYITDWLNTKDTAYKWDSTFQYIQRYNRAIQFAQPYVDLGVNASPLQLLLINPSIKPGFQSGLHQYPLQNADPDKMQFYKAAVPFTKFSYVQGGNGFFSIEGLHTQNIVPTWNITAQFNSSQNGEIYTGSKQNNLHRGIQLGSHFSNRKGNYENIIMGNWNKTRRNENFGLIPEADTLFFVQKGKNSSFTPDYYPSNITATSSFSSYHHVFAQKLYLSEQKNIYVFHRSDLKREKLVFKESDPSPDSVHYGRNYNFQSGAFQDSTAWSQWNNEFGIGNSIQRSASFPLLWKIYYGADRIVYNSVYKTAPNIYYNQSLHAKVIWNPYEINKLTISGQTDYYFLGINQGDYKISGNIGWVAKDLSISAGINSQAYTAPFYTNMFTSNFKQYINNLGQVKMNSLNGSIHYKNKRIKTYARLETGNADNYIYVDEQSNFKQTSGLVFATLQGGINIRFGHFYMDHKFTFQSQNKTAIIPVPKFSEIMSLYYEGFLFKKAMYARIGADISIMGSYNGYNYNPEIASFYPTKIATGNYPIADFFLSGEVKTVQLFVKFEHLNQLATNYGFNNRYYSAIGYPIEPFRLRLGLVWKFYN